MQTAKAAVITIHGVGAAEPGLTLAQLSIGFEVQRAPSEYTSCILNGNRYAALIADNTEMSAFYEVNWSDVRRPNKSWVAQLAYWLQLALAMLSIAEHWTHSEVKRSKTVALYRGVTEAFILWLAPIGVFLMLLTSNDALVADQWKRVFVWLTATALTALAAVGLRRRRFALCVGSIAATAFFAIAGAFAVCKPTVSYTFTFDFAKIQGFCYFLLILLMFAVLTSVLLDRKMPLTQRLSRLAIAYIPILGISIAGSVLWVLALIPASTGKSFNQWQETYLMGLSYNLEHLEIAMSVELGLLFALVFLGVGLYFVLSRQTRGTLRNEIECRNEISLSKPNGKFAQDWLLAILSVLPVILCIVPLVWLYDALRLTWLWQGDPSSVHNSSVIEIYLASATRALGVLPFTLTGLTVIADVLSDIVFYVDPEQNDPKPYRHHVGESGMRTVTCGRLSAILRALLATGCPRIVVAAHSQGSMIAAEVVSSIQDSRIYLVTFGSPISSLYERFLGWRVPDVGLQRWTNLYRIGDYIGGPVTGAANQTIGPGGHLDYWNENKVSNAIADALQVSAGTVVTP